MIYKIGLRFLLMISLAYYFSLHGDNQEFFVLINSKSFFDGDELPALFSELGNAAISLSFVAAFLYHKPELCKRFIFLFVTTAIVVYLLKKGFGMQRPLAVLGESVDVIGKPLTANSFPSGHTTSIFSALLFIGFNTSKYKVLALCFLTSVLAGVARIEVGAHWPADIMAGAGIAVTLCVTSKVFITSNFKWAANQLTILALSLLLTFQLVSIQTTLSDQLLVQILFYSMAILNLYLASRTIIHLKRGLTNKRIKTPLYK